MFEIAICDDDADFARAFQARVERALGERGAACRVSLFSNPAALQAFIEGGGRVDLIFQDVLFDTERGIRFAKLLKQRRWNIDVIFVTTSQEYAVDGYDAHPLHYLVKPIADEKLGEALECFLEKHTPQHLCLATAKGVIHLPLSEILYFEIFDHEILIHKVGGGRETLAGTLKEVERALPPDCFARPHRSYLVNLEHVSEIARYRLRLSSEETVPISKGLYQHIQRCLINYASRGSAAL